MRYSSVIALSTLLAVTLATPQPQIEEPDSDDFCITECYASYLDALNNNSGDTASAEFYSQCIEGCGGILDEEDGSVDGVSDSEEVAEGSSSDEEDEDEEEEADAEDVEDTSDEELAEGSEEDEEPATPEGDDAASNVHLSVSVLALAGLVVSFFNL